MSSSSDPKHFDPETGERISWPLGFEIVVEVAALKTVTPEVWMSGLERYVTAFRETAKDLYLEYHPDAEILLP